MHIPDGYLGPQTCGAAYAVMLPVWAIAARRLRGSLKGERAPLLGLAAAFSFVVMMLNIPWAGTTGHATGAALIAILLGPEIALVAVSVALAIQALLFGDGGVSTFAANCFSMALVMPFVASGVFALLAGRSPKGAPRRFIAAIVAGYISLNVAALCTAVMFGIQPLIAHDAAGRALYSPYSLQTALVAIMSLHLLIFGFAEGALTGLALRYFEGIPQAWNPAFQSVSNDSQVLPAQSRAFYLRWWKIVILLVLLSPLGLLIPAWLGAGTAWGEWSAQELARMTGHLPKGMAALAEKWKAPLPGYVFPHGTSPAGQVFAYIISAAIGVGLLFGLSWALEKRLGRERKRTAVRQSLAKTQEAFVGFAREAIFAEHWARSRHLLQSLEVRAKLICLAAALLAISLLQHPFYIALMAGAALGLALHSRIGLRGLKHPLWWAGPLLAMIIALPIIFNPLNPGRALIIFSHQPFFAITVPGLEVAGRLVLRVTASVWWVGAVLLSSRWDQVLAALRSLKVPALFVFALAMAHRYLFLLVRLGEKSLYARRSRTILAASAATERALMGAKVANLFRHSLALSTQAHSAMVARGFTGEFRTLGEARFTAKDLLWLAGNIIFCAALVFLDYALYRQGNRI
jgi:cobalt/nickel transport system permease protein